jgi:two-component sensor histidine kinase
LQAVIDITVSTEIKKNTLLLMGEHVVQRDPDFAEQIAKELEEDYKNMEDNDKRRLKYIFAASNRWQGDYTTALLYYNQIYNESKKSNDSLDIAKSGHFIGTLNLFIGKTVEAQQFLLEAADLYDSIGTDKNKAAISSSIANLYVDLNQQEKSEKWYLKALKQFSTLKDSAGMASVHANLGVLYTDLGDFKKAQMHLLTQKSMNSVFPTLREMGFHHDFMGKLRQKEGKLKEAYDEILKGLKIREKLSSTYNLCESKLNIGEILILLEQYPEAIAHVKEIFNYTEHQSLNQQSTAYFLLSKAYEQSGEFKNALINYKLYKEISDSITNESSIAIIAEKDAQFNLQKQQSEIVVLNAEKAVSKTELFRSKVVIIISVGALLIFVLAMIVLYKMYAKIKAKNLFISKTLKERELLLHEIHHRVKNNLQMISSLLNLQSKYVEDEKAYEALQAGKNRVLSMAVLHNLLYSGNEIAAINIQQYFEGLSKSTLNTYKIPENEISIKIFAQNIVMEVDMVFQLGLIVNELLTNSLKHAFPENRIEQPRIIITLQEEQDKYTLTIVDNGVGISNTPGGKKNENSFGQKLIDSLAQKFNATMQINSVNGTEVVMVIPKK